MITCSIPARQLCRGPPPSGHDIACVVFTSVPPALEGGPRAWAAVAAGTMTLTGVPLTGDDVIYHMAAANHLIARVHVLATAQLVAASCSSGRFGPRNSGRTSTASGAPTRHCRGDGHFIMSQPETEGDADHPLAR